MVQETDVSRSLSRINEKVSYASKTPESILAELVESGRPLSVLEVGFGWGRVLLELSWRFRDAEIDFFGIDVQQQPPVERKEDLRAIARRYAVVPENEVDTLRLPELFFYDATNLQFPDESMDYVYSAVTVRFIRDKARFLEEVCRVLKPGGVALLHLGESDWEYPYSLAFDDRILTPYTNRFVLRHGNELIPLPTYLKLFENGVYRFDFTPKSSCILEIHKEASGQLDLELGYNDTLSATGKKLPLLSKHGEQRGGFRTVYDVKPQHYDALFHQGLLAKAELRTDVRQILDD